MGELSTMGTLSALRMLEGFERERRHRMMAWDTLMGLVAMAEHLKALREEEKRNPPPFSYAPAYLPRWPSKGERDAYAAAESKRARKAARRLAGARP